jgi:hypothetical protein
MRNLSGIGSWPLTTDRCFLYDRRRPDDVGGDHARAAARPARLDVPGAGVGPSRRAALGWGSR